MSKHNRDNFTEKTRRQIAMRVGWHCSDPSCRRPTVGSNSTGDGEIDVGIAAHICAAAPGGPRYDPNQTPEQRRSAENGIWLCNIHGKAVDAKDSMFTVELLREWKAQAQKDSWRRVLYNDMPGASASRPLTQGELGSRVRAAAEADLKVFRRSAKWPSTTIALTLEVDSLPGPVTTSALATAITTLDDLVLVAPPGTGKTTTLFQVAESMLASGSATPIVVPLGDWSAEGSSLFESFLRRPAFRDISEEDLRAVMVQPGVVLLLDGWNELNARDRRSLTAQVTSLQAELPKIGFMITTRKQFLDVPISGTRINLLPLNETQQREIAKAMRGDVGIRMIDQARRTHGVRDLVSIPLYLTALLTLPGDVPFPATKEEILRRFVAMHEENPLRAESLLVVLQGLHQRFLEELAVCATSAGNTTITGTVARKSASDTSNTLVTEGQLSEKSQPTSILETLVSHHILMRIGEPTGYSFQHQQFQEWYASHFVERLMIAGVSDEEQRDTLISDVLNQPEWEEAILFACERMASGSQSQQEACCATILAAFEVDPMLAAEMIFCSTDEIWDQIESEIRSRIEQWHTPGKVDRALRFMINSGRPEFFDRVWPLITDENDQVHLAALRAGRRFRPSILGNDAAKRIASLPLGVRKNVLHEIVFNSDLDGIDFAAAFARETHEPEIKASVVDALAFRYADLQIVEVLHGADERTFDLLAHGNLLDDLDDEYVRKNLRAARERRLRTDVSDCERLRTIISWPGDDDFSSDLVNIVGEAEIDKEQEAIVHLIYEANKRYPDAIANGLLRRVRSGRTLFYGVDNLLSSAGVILEDEELFDLALSYTGLHESRAEAAASVLGPNCVGRMIDAVLKAKKALRDPSGKFNQGASERYYVLVSRIEHTPGTSLITAVGVRSARAGNEEMATLADLICRHQDGGSYHVGPLDNDAQTQIYKLAEDWGHRMLASDSVTRSQLASIAWLVSRAPSVGLLELLKRLLDEELRLYRVFRDKAEKMNWRQSPETNEARTLHNSAYQRAFQATEAPQTTALMSQYLQDEQFGHTAALVLAAQWIAKNEPSDRKHFWGGVDFSRVEERRAERANDPSATSVAAEAIFNAIQPLLSDKSTKEQQRLAVSLGIVAARLPHGQREDTIGRLISLAPRRSRAVLLRNLVLSGEIIDIELAKIGLEEVFEAAKTERWILSDGCYEVRDWLSLLPFSDPPTQAFTIVRGLPDDERTPHRLKEMITCYGFAPSDEAEEVLFLLADADPDLYANRSWLGAVMSRGTPSAARRFVDLAANGMFAGKGMHSWLLAQQIGALINDHHKLREHIYRLLKDGATTPGLRLLARAIAESPDVDGLLLLAKIEIEHKISFISRHDLEKVVTKQKPSENWAGAYNIIPVSAVELRRMLLTMTTDGGPADVAARYLIEIDKIRDEYGWPDSEPRHPDLASGKPWPIMTSHLDKGVIE